jgi:hypothetical protein
MLTLDVEMLYSNLIGNSLVFFAFANFSFREALDRDFDFSRRLQMHVSSVLSSDLPSACFAIVEAAW